MTWCRMCEREVQRGTVCEAFHGRHHYDTLLPATLTGGPRGSMGEEMWPTSYGEQLALHIEDVHRRNPEAFRGFDPDEADRLEIERINLRRA